MPYKEKEIEKRYFTIGEIAAELGVATSLLRFWEGQFFQIKPKKNRKGNRQYTQNDRAIIRKVYHFVKEKGMTLEGARKRIEVDISPEEVFKKHYLKAAGKLPDETIMKNMSYCIDAMIEYRRI